MEEAPTRHRFQESVPPAHQKVSSGCLRGRMVRSTRTDMASIHTATRRQPGSLSRLSPLLLPEKGRFCTENLSLMSLGLDSSIRRKCVWAHCVVCDARYRGGWNWKIDTTYPPRISLATRAYPQRRSCRHLKTCVVGCHPIDGQPWCMRHSGRT